MSLENDIFTALCAVPEVARSNPTMFAVHPVMFPQPVRYSPEWPKIRYTFISRVPVVDLCGDGDDDTTDTRVQIDVCAETFSEAQLIRLEVMGIMRNFDPPAILSLSNDEFDVETKTHRAILDYEVQPSTGSGSP